MGNRREVGNTIDNTAFGSSLGEAKEADLSSGYFDAGPEGNYEGSLDGEEVFEFGPGMSGMKMYTGGTLHAGQIEPDGYRKTHNGDVEDEYGFLRRPKRGSDVERT